MSARSASVWHGDTKVGVLNEDAAGRLVLSYDAAWARSGFPISISLPISDAPRDAHAFFAGLLPEGASRKRVCRQLGIGEHDDVGLLLALGRDCAGALSVTPGDSQPEPDASTPSISAEELALLIESHGQALPQSSERERFSLAGAQDKVALHIDGDRIWLPTHHRPSTHIFKFETIKKVCFAEYAAHDMAERIGLPVVSTRYHAHGESPPVPYLRVGRYDRARDADGTLVRLHQEDFTQAMGLAAASKYEEDGGPSLAQIAQLIRNVTDGPTRDIQRLRDWQLFNYLIGNADGHAKNISLLYPRDGEVPELAPMYDLVAIECLNSMGMHFNRKMAFYIGDSHLPERVTRADWIALAKSIHIPQGKLLERLRDMALALPDIAQTTRAAFAAAHGDNTAYDHLAKSVAKRCRWVLASVFGQASR